MNLDVRDFNLVQHGADLDGRHGRMIEKIYKSFERLLEVDVVLPKSVVSIDQQVLPPAYRRHRFVCAGPRRNGISATMSTATA